MDIVVEPVNGSLSSTGLPRPIWAVAVAVAVSDMLQVTGDPTARLFLSHYICFFMFMYVFSVSVCFCPFLSFSASSYSIRFVSACFCQFPFFGISASIRTHQGNIEGFSVSRMLNFSLYFWLCIFTFVHFIIECKIRQLFSLYETTEKKSDNNKNVAK